VTGAEASFEDSTGLVPQEARSPAAIMIVSNCFFIVGYPPVAIIGACIYD
jgi:hypothetical protein